MGKVGERERNTQQRVIEFFRSSSGYTYLGCWKDRVDSSNVEKGLLAGWSTRQGHGRKIVDRVLHQLTGPLSFPTWTRRLPRWSIGVTRHAPSSKV